LIVDHIDAIVDLSNVDATSAPAVQAAGIPVVGDNTNDVPMFSNPDFHPEGQSADSQAVAYILTIKSLEVTGFGDMYGSEIVDCTQFNDLIAKDRNQRPFAELYNRDFRDNPNYTAQCVAADQKHIKVLFSSTGLTVMTRRQGGHHAL
jgi:branched-chain amino acid transport system substrate-binding protein